MLDVTLSILAVIAGGVTMELFTLSRAQLACRDEAGVLSGSGPFEIIEDFQTGNPS